MRWSLSWPWRAPADDLASTEVPARVDVVVVGGGWGGLAVGTMLAERGVDVVVVESRPSIGDAAAGREPGQVLLGLVEHPFRVRYALGDEAARALYGFSARAISLLDARVGVAGPGWWAATDEREPDQLHSSTAALNALGFEAHMVSPEEADRHLGGHGFGPAMRMAQGGLLAPGSLERLARACLDAGASVVTGCAVQAVEEVRGGLRVCCGTTSIQCEVAVLVAETELGAIDPWFEDKITCVREQALATASIPVQHPRGGRCGYGYTTFRQLAGGQLVVSGARWATPHMEVGEVDDTVTVPAVQRRLEAFLHRHFDHADVPISHRWSWITGHTCDGLPIVGPLPGSSRLVACTGFGGNEPGLALAAAEAVTTGLLDDGVAVELPRALSAGRFL